MTRRHRITVHLAGSCIVVDEAMWEPLVMTNIAMENGPFIDGLPVYLLKMVIFHGEMLNNQRVTFGILNGKNNCLVLEPPL